MTEKAISPLRQRPKTQHHYIRHVKALRISLAGLPARPPPRMSIGTSCGWRRSERRCQPSTSVPRLYGSSSRSR